MTVDRPRGRQRRGEESRYELLQAGVELLREKDLDAILGPRAVSERAQRSTGSFFHYWRSGTDYVGELLEFALRPGSVAAIDAIAEMLERSAGEHLPPVETIRAVCRHDFELTIRDPLLAVQFLLWAKHDDSRARGALDDFYNLTDQVLVPRFELVASEWNRQARTPLDLRTVSVITTALLEGLAVRHLVQPHCVPPDLYGEAVLAMLPVLTADLDDARPFDSVVAEINRGGRGAASCALQEGRDRSRCESTREPEDSEVRTIRTTRTLAIAAFGEALRVWSSTTNSELTDRSPVAAISSCMHSLAALVAQHRVAAAAFLEMTCQERQLEFPHGGIAAPTDVVRSLIERGQALGQFDDTLPAPDAAECSIEMLIARILSHPDERPVRAARLTIRLCLAGMEVRHS